MSIIPEPRLGETLPASAPAPSAVAAPSRSFFRTISPSWIAITLLAGITLLAYARIGECGFVNIDDDAYVEFQPMVNRGLRPAAVVWAFTESHSGIWHPLASLSHALDCTLFGVRPAPMHWENVLLHALNVVLVFCVGRRWLGGGYRAAFVAALFGLHPLNVESVAWISERKNVLSTMFWLLALLAYGRYVQAPSWRRYASVAGWFTLGLLTKPMLVTFPCVLLLLDWWPLARWRQPGWGTLLKEKLPLLALTVAVSLATLAAQAQTGATDYGHRFSFAARLGNAIVSYARYLGKAAWPESLSVFYFHPGMWPNGPIAAAFVLLVAISVLAWHHVRTRPWLAFGWLWFLGTLVPVIGLVQSGAQAMADRYAYLPLLGIFTVVAFAGAEYVGRFPRHRSIVVAGALAALAAGFVLTRRQVTYWRDSGTLYRHSLAVGEDNPAVRFLYASSLLAAGRPDAEVLPQYQRALELQPDYVNALTQLAAYALAQNRPAEARALIERSIQCEPTNPNLHYNLGSFFVRTGKIDDAIRTYQRVLQLNPNSAGAHLELGQIYLNQNRVDSALAEYRERARLDRWNADAQCDYGILLGNMRHFSEALEYLEKTLWLLPDHARAKAGIEALRKLAPGTR